MKKTTLSASVGMMSSLKASFRPSASDCSRPNGPTWFGPGRTCIRATTRRSYQIANSVITTRNTKTDEDLDEDQPPRVVAEVDPGSGSLRSSAVAACLPAITDTTAPAVTPSVRRTVEPGEFVGSQTTPSAMSVIVARAA